MTRLINAERISTAPASVYYLPEFITRAEEQQLLDKVLSAPKPKWVYLKNRRLQNWGGIVSEKGMIAEPLPSWLSDMFPRFQESGVFEGLDATQQVPNHCLPHKDGPAYLPTVATISLSSHCVLEFFAIPDVSKEKDEPSDDLKRHDQEPEFSLLVQPRSLLVLKDDVYNNYMHGIREASVDDLRQSNIVNLAEALPEGLTDSNALMKRDVRISLTFRIVQKALKVNKILLRC
ncbi:Alpha-ketoglutarate-dependent dioxygenase alkB 6 [Mortierella claussenii]|nr:Alpha-ketoglutarate-dependent dioxygenase alkB 6 [Mortierella claussenii]